ncbi:hypothetical protein B0H13DRAFT_2413773 [Mycena leptocephala]|nr:hypothetical protein B0H13DRAFT_2413773 [Mycena leptocephala]
MDAFLGEMFDGQEEYEIMKAIKLSLQDERNYLARGSHALISSMMAGSCTSSSASTRPKRPLDSSADSVSFAGWYLLTEYDRRNATPPLLPMKYASGTLRLTRTSGRQHAPNAISLDDLIHPPDLSTALVYSFFIDDPYLFDFLPFKTSRHHRPYVNVYVGRDIAMDADGKRFPGCKPKTKRPNPVDFDRVVELAKKGFREKYANNFYAFYPKLQSGCAHSKIMVLVYPEFMRVVITSANLMQCDTVYGDNHWYIQDFPRLSDGAAYTETPFERLSQAGVFDFSAAKAYEYGQLRLRKVVCNLLKKRYREDKNKVPKMTFEICVGSVGHLENEGVVSNFLESCAGKSAGVDRRRTGAQNDIPYDARCESVEVRACCALHPPVSFPSVVSLRSPTRIAFVDPQGNISSHIDWNALEEKNAEYLKDHLALHRHSSNQKRRPMYMYLGSANFSSSAWGKVEREGRNRAIAAILRTERLEKPGSRWEDIVPYERPTEVNHYKDGERPWKMRKSDIEGPEPPIMDWDDADADDENKDQDDEAEERHRAVMQLAGILTHFLCPASGSSTADA